MTQAAPGVAPIIETHRLSDADAGELERRGGCLVVKMSLDLTGPMTPPVRVEDYDQACLTAAYMAAQDPRRTFAVYKPASFYHAESAQPPVEVGGDT